MAVLVVLKLACFASGEWHCEASQHTSQQESRKQTNKDRGLSQNGDGTRNDQTFPPDQTTSSCFFQSARLQCARKLVHMSSARAPRRDTCAARTCGRAPYFIHLCVFCSHIQQCVYFGRAIAHAGTAMDLAMDPITNCDMCEYWRARALGAEKALLGMQLGNVCPTTPPINQRRRPASPTEENEQEEEPDPEAMEYEVPTHPPMKEEDGDDPPTLDAEPEDVYLLVSTG